VYFSVLASRIIKQEVILYGELLSEIII